MMSPTFQLVLVCVTLASLVFISYLIVRRQMRIKYALIWFLLNLILVVLAVFPQLVMSLASILHVHSDTNTIFLIMIFILYCICFSFSIIFSRNSARIKNLTQEIGILKAKVESMKLQSAEEDIEDHIA